MSLIDTHIAHGAKLAQDGIPLHYGDLAKEYSAALDAAILLDRSHEGRIQVFGSSRYELLNRMSTNKLVEVQQGEGRPTIFTTSNARIIDRIIAYNRADHLLLITEPGRGTAVRNLLQRNIFFGDEARLLEITGETNQFALVGTQADAIVAALDPALAALPPLHSADISVAGATIFAAQRKALSGSHWVFVAKQDEAQGAYQAILEAGEAFGLIPAGSLTYNTLRIRAGRPARPELTSDFIPLEIGLWDEVSFTKGCYTGQEIIARMESRGKLAKTMISLQPERYVQAPADVYQNGQMIGTMTSSVEAPTGEIFALAVVRTRTLNTDEPFAVGETKVVATFRNFAGVQPAEQQEN